MQIECWLVTALCRIDDLPVAAFDNEDEAHDECTRLRNLPSDEQEAMIERLTLRYDLPDQSQYLKFVVRHVPNQLSRNVAGE